MEIIEQHLFAIPKDGVYTIWFIPDNLYEDALEQLPENSIEFIHKTAFEGDNCVSTDTYVKLSKSHYQRIEGILEYINKERSII